MTNIEIEQSRLRYLFSKKRILDIINLRKRVNNINILLFTIDKFSREYDELYEEKEYIMTLLEKENVTKIDLNDMSKMQAVVHMYENPYKKITHKSFKDYEYIYYDKKDDCIKDESNNIFENWSDDIFTYNGILMRNGEKWEHNWRIYK